MTRRSHPAVLALAVLPLLAGGAPAPGAPATGAGATVAELVARGDAAWRRRAEGHQGTRAAPGPIGEAVAAYEAALAADPENLEARWKLLRALYFQGDFVLTDSDVKLAVFERGRDLGEAGLDRIAARRGGREALEKLEPVERAERLAGEPEAAALTFWTAAHWGLWGRHRGKIAAARQGVAGKVRDYAETVIALDPKLENAGGRRVLGRLHTEAPKLPFVTGWIDRDRAVSELEQAVEMFPDDLGHRVYLAEALLEFRPQRRAEALAMLRAIVAAEPDPAYLLEQMQFQADARALLEKWG